NSPMAKKIAAFIIAPMWHDFVSKALTKYSSQSDAFPTPTPDPDLDALPPVLKGNWNTDPAKGVHDILWWINKDNPRSGSGGNPSDSQYAYWDYPVQLWAQSNGSFTGITGPATAIGGGGTPAPSGFTITSPTQGSTVSWGPAFTASVSYPSSMQISQVSYFLNNSI